MSDNWVVRNLENALETWNDKLTEIWGLLTATPEEFKGGKIWNVILDINGALQVIGTALLVLFFVVGVMKTCGSFAEVKKPEHALRLFIRFALAKGAITYGLDLMLSLFKIVQGTISTIMTSAGFGQANETTLPQVDTTAPAVTMVWKYVSELIFNMLVLVGAVKTSDRIVREMMGL